MLHQMLVEAPLLALARMSRRHVIFGLILLAMLFAASEFIMLLGTADVAMVLAWDVSIYVDALVAAWAFATVTRSKAAWQALASVLARPLRTARQRASRRRRANTEKAANDSDDDGGAWAYALAA
jgi:hypothetical protein